MLKSGEIYTMELIKNLILKMHWKMNSLETLWSMSDAKNGATPWLPLEPTYPV